MTTYINELEPLEDILDILAFEDEPSIFSEEYAVELVESALHLMEEYMGQHPNAISDPDFHEILLEEIKEIFYVQMEDHILESDYIEDDMNDLLEDAFNIFISTFHPERSIEQNNNEEEEEDNGEKIDEKEINIIEKKIQVLREIPQPVQRTPEWYTFRWNLITASNAWKAFESQNTINQLIYEKCQPLKDFSIEEDEEIKMVNTNTTLHWGQKYEPLSVMMYEHLYNSKVEDFGCIQHPVYKFIGASPDGIIVESNTGRYGRMLEIKNIVNREINGIPKKEYWVQMQLQMEVCDLDECDFLETKFTEYPDYESYKNDSSNATFEGKEFNSLTTTASGSYKGIIIYFHTKEGKPHYEYMPLNIWTPNDISDWEETTIHKFESEPYKYIFVKFIYWKLEKLSCVLVLRNKEWFKNNVGQIEKVWKIIEQERITGYDHRAPVKKTKKEQATRPYVDNKEICFLKVIKVDSSRENPEN
jgi:putative phage-type endonuclease